MRRLNYFMAASLLLAPIASACDVNEGPLEEAGEALDEAADDIEDAVD